MNKATTPQHDPSGYFLYHSIGIYPNKEADLTQAMGDFAQAWSAPNSDKWGYVLGQRQQFLQAWQAIIKAPEKSLTTCDSVTQGVHAMITGLPEGYLRGRKLLVAADCFPSLHFLLSGLAPRLGFTLVTVPLRPGATWVETEDFIAHWDKEVGLALITWVTSTASARCDLAALTAHGRKHDTVIAVDITQAAGLLPFDVSAPKVDAVISTSLKWLCGTPGAGILYMDPALALECAPELRGWFSQADPFSWDIGKFTYAPDMRRFDNGTPASIAALASLPALQWHARQDHDARIRHNRALAEQIIALADRLGLPLQSPRKAEQRGGSVMLRLNSKIDAAATVKALAAVNIAVDHRDAILRLSPGIVTQPAGIEKAFSLLAR